MGMQIKGHEFHYSKAIEFKGDKSSLVFDMQRGVGLMDGKDGICYKNVLATYTHIHALGTTSWAGALIEKARIFKINQIDRHHREGIAFKGNAPTNA